MTLSSQGRDELYELLGLLFDEQLDEQGQNRLAELLVASEEARWIYVREANLHASLTWDWRMIAGEGGESESGAKCRGAADAADPGSFRSVDVTGQALTRELSVVAGDWDVETAAVEREVGTSAACRPAGGGPFVVTDLAASGRSSLGLFAPGGILFSYAVAAVFVVFGLLAGWLRQIPHADITVASGRVAVSMPSPAPSSTEQDGVFVGRITGLVDCRWADPKTEAYDSAYVPLGRKYALSSGLMEITYTNGSKVLLQGPATYEVDSHDGGYLTVGKLTVRVEKTPGDTANSAIGHKDTSSQCLGGPAFAIRTPTATVADLGTEFGIAVDASGASEAYVFRGQVEMRLKGTENQSPRVIALRENESASVRHEADFARVIRRRTPPSSFARKIPRRVPIAIKSTGIGLKEGEIDPHWQVVARSDAPSFQPHPATVVPVDATYRLPNDPSQSQWLSVSKELMLLPDEVTHTFRTTFDLTGMLPNTAVLRGRFLVDDHITAIRLNGRPIPLPSNSDTISFYNYRTFEATTGFLEGRNVLEIDVLNGKYRGSSPTSASFMALRVEVRGSVIPNWHRAPLEERQPPAVGKKEVSAGR